MLHDRAGCGAAWCAFVLGVASAAVSAYWAAGGTGLLDTVGGSIERWGRERSFAVLVVLVAPAALKLVIAVAAPLAAGAVHAPAWMVGRVPRLLSWIAAHPGPVRRVLTAAGLLVQSGVIEPGPPKPIGTHWPGIRGSGIRGSCCGGSLSAERSGAPG